LQRYTEGLRSSAELAMDRWHRNLELLLGKLEALSPFAVLQRGYSLVRDPKTGRVLTRASHFSLGQQAEVVLADGKLEVTINEVVKSDEVAAGTKS
jgi:exodeoxyribonuclease VII large subunit